MNNWQSLTYDFGKIRKNTSKTITFQANPVIPEIADFSTPCGCTKIKWDGGKRILTIQYNAGEVPKHLGNRNQEITKYVHITYKDGTTDTLTIKGIKTH